MNEVQTAFDPGGKMQAIEISQDEKRNKKISPEHLKNAVKALREDGVVLLNELLDKGQMEILRDRMLEDVDSILARDDVPFNFNVGNLQQDPPPFPPYLFRDVLVNDIVIEITHSVLGAGLRSSFYSGNNALPKKGMRQPVHADSGQLWPDLEVATPPYALVINVLPVDVSPENGSTEIWPGTHLDTSVSWQQGEIKVDPQRLEERRKVVPPIQPAVKAGSVVIRDMRLWHAGMPNNTDTPRPMIAMIHYVSWWTALDPVPFAKGTESLFEHPILTTNARFVDGPIDYLHHNKAFDFKK
jgi:hypothetical protein